VSITENIVGTRALNALRVKLANAKAAAEQKRQAENIYKEVAGDAMPDLLLVDGKNGSGVRFEYEGKEYAAIVCQPDSQWHWDPAPLVEYLKSIGKFDDVSVTVLDPEKLESEMAAGNIDRKKMKKFQVEKPATPYVKFINPKPDSK
jgi:hypothetical protein